jgi:glycosyltransferase involved in cell wall biosynthesis
LLIFKILPYLKKYQIVHVHLFPAQYWVVFAKLLAFSKVKLLFTEHSNSNRRIRNSFIGIFDKFIYNQYVKIVCITSNVFQVVLKHAQINSTKLEIIENGVDTKKFFNATKLLNEDFLSDVNSKYVIQVSSFQEPKDQPTLIKALKFVPEHIKLLLVGDGVLKSECEHLVAKLGLQARVFFLGVRVDVPQLLKTADIIVLSSKYEGLSLSSIEGMASGKPFVASNVPGLKDIVTDAGLLFPLGDVQKLAEIINNLVNDEVLYNNTAKACMQKAQQFDISNMVNKHIELYKQMLS